MPSPPLSLDILRDPRTVFKTWEDGNLLYYAPKRHVHREKDVNLEVLLFKHTLKRTMNNGQVISEKQNWIKQNLRIVKRGEQWIWSADKRESTKDLWKQMF